MILDQGTTKISLPDTTACDALALLVFRIDERGTLLFGVRSVHQDHEL